MWLIADCFVLYDGGPLEFLLPGDGLVETLEA